MPERQQKLAWVLLIEPLSYQFASSVRWIETQDLFFEQYKFEHFIKVGPSPTLAGMAVHTLKAKYETKDDSAGCVHHIFCASKDQKDIYYQFEDEPEAAPEQDSPAEATNPAPAPAAAVNATPPATASPATSIKDVPIRAVYQRFKTRSWVTFRASFHPPLTRVRSFCWRSLALPLDLVIPAIFN